MMGDNYNTKEYILKKILKKNIKLSFGINFFKIYDMLIFVSNEQKRFDIVVSNQYKFMNGFIILFDQYSVYSLNRAIDLVTQVDIYNKPIIIIENTIERNQTLDNKINMKLKKFNNIKKYITISKNNNEDLFKIFNKIIINNG